MDNNSSNLERELSPAINHVPKKEALSFYFGLMGQNFVYSLVAGYLMYFCTNILKMNEVWSGLIVGISRVWDGVNDPIVGSWIDRHRFANGEKVRPFLKWLPIPVGIVSLLMFMNWTFLPEWAMGLMILLLYLTWDILYTVQDIPIWSMTAMITPNPNERERIVKNARLFGSITYGMLSGGLWLVLDIMRTLEMKDMTIFLIFGLVLGLGGALISRLCYSAKERVPMPKAQQENMKESFSLMFKNKMLMLLSLANILGAFGFGGALTPYFFENLTDANEYGLSFIQNIGLSTLFGALTGAPALISMFFVDKFAKKFKGMLNLLIIAQLLNVVFRIIAWIVGFEGNLLWVSAGILALASFFSGTLGIANTSLFNDSIDYIEWQTGKRTEGVTFAMQTFLAKASSGINALLLGIALAAIGYNKDVSGIGSQGSTFNTWTWPLFILTPALGSLLYIIPLLKIKYPSEMKKKVEQDLLLRREGKAESGDSPFYKEVLAAKFEVAEEHTENYGNL